MAIPTVFQQPLSLRMLATFRRFIRWLTSTQVALSLIMLVLMFYMIIIPFGGSLAWLVVRTDMPAES